MPAGIPVLRKAVLLPTLSVPATHVGHSGLSLAQLKILQEAITLTALVPCVVFYMNQPLKFDYLWAALCILGAVYFIFRPQCPPKSPPAA
jgi:uncharacterized protein (DUF486 family)